MVFLFHAPILQSGYGDFMGKERKSEKKGTHQRSRSRYGNAYSGLSTGRYMLHLGVFFRGAWEGKKAFFQNDLVIILMYCRQICKHYSFNLVSNN
jgi:hypothetical protein